MKGIIGLAALAAAFGATAAHANSLNGTLEATDNNYQPVANGLTYTFTLDTANAGNFYNVALDFYDVPVSVSNNTTTTFKDLYASTPAGQPAMGYSSVETNFYNGNSWTLTGDSIIDNSFQLVPGTYDLYGYNAPSSFVLTLSAPGPAGNTGSVSATPEPSSLALLGSGLLGCAGLLRRRVLAERG